MSNLNYIIPNMDKIMRKLITAILFIFVVWPFFLVPLSNATPPDKRCDIINLLKISGAAGIVSKIGIYASNQIIDNLQRNEIELTPRIIEIIREENSALIYEQTSDDQALFSFLIPIYDKYFTHNEIKGLISFYDSELGRKTVQVMPSLMDECFAAREKWGQFIVPIAVDRIVKRLEAEGIKLPK
jgi:hypothetical protein